MNLILDIGNTRTKVSIFSNEKLIEHLSINIVDENFLLSFLNKYAIKRCIVSSVSDSSEQIISLLPNNVNTIKLNKKTLLPIKNNYATKATLGSDRIAAACGAFHLYPNSNVLIIDAGTALTYEFINNNNEYIGGGISPGIEMRFKALNSFTSKLPLLNKKNISPNLIGNSTDSCIESGVLNGIFAEVDGIIDRYKQYYTNLKVILTGGDTKSFDKNLKNSIFAIPFLVEIGLNRILNHNVK